MKVVVKKIIDASRFIRHNYKVELVEGVQSFDLAFIGTQTEAKWFAQMFRKALRSHDLKRKKK